MNIKTTINRMFILNRNRRIFKAQDKKFARRMGYHINGIPNLNKTQEALIQSFYNEYNLKTTTIFHRFVAAINGNFSKLYVHPGLFYTCIEPALNDCRISLAFADKNFYNRFFPNERFPITIGRCISGVFYDGNYKHIQLSDIKSAIRIKEFVAIKPAIDSGGGNCVKLLRYSDQIENDLAPYIQEGNFLIQCVAKQHVDMRAYNESSLNIVRLISVFLDGEVYIPSVALRIGAPGAFNDNYIDEIDRSMLTIGLDRETGKVCSEAYFASGGTSNTCLNGYDYHNRQIPAFNEMLATARRLHPQLPHLKMISWDFFVEADGHASVMELNTHGQGIAYYQYTNGPLFYDEELTRRVLDEVVKCRKRNSYNERL